MSKCHIVGNHMLRLKNVPLFYVVVTHRNRLYDRPLLSTENLFKLRDKNMLQFKAQKGCVYLYFAYVKNKYRFDVMPMKFSRKNILLIN